MNNGQPGDALPIEPIDLGQGFSLQQRVDFSGHGSGKVDPHVNADLLNPSGQKVGLTNNGADFRDLTNNQLPGFNGMQNP